VTLALQTSDSGMRTSPYRTIEGRLNHDCDAPALLGLHHRYTADQGQVYSGDLDDDFCS
jgi:hypothetical protein